MVEVLEQVSLIPMSAKPYHAGHDALVRIAAGESDHVELYVSLADRGKVTGAMMQKVWLDHILPNLPSNVIVNFSKVTPVRDIYERLGEADKTVPLPRLTFNIYSDAEDVYRNFPDKSLDKYLPNLMKSFQLFRRGIERHETVQISGEMMRDYLGLGLKAEFIAGLPKWMDGEAVWKILRS